MVKKVIHSWVTIFSKFLLNIVFDKKLKRLLIIDWFYVLYWSLWNWTDEV